MKNTYHNLRRGFELLISTRPGMVIVLLMTLAFFVPIGVGSYSIDQVGEQAQSLEKVVQTIQTQRKERTLDACLQANTNAAANNAQTELIRRVIVDNLQKLDPVQVEELQARLDKLRVPSRDCKKLTETINDNSSQ